MCSGGFQKQNNVCFSICHFQNCGNAEGTSVGHSIDGSDTGASLGQSKTEDTYWLCCADRCVFEGHAELQISRLL